MKKYKSIYGVMVLLLSLVLVQSHSVFGNNAENTELVVANVLKGKQPTSNSPHLIKSELSTIPDVQIKNPAKSTDGSKNGSHNDNNNTKIIAGEETGGADNGYAKWTPVYLQYDFGKAVPVQQVNIYRNTYDNAISTFKKVKVELSTTAEFTPETTKTIFAEQDVVETVQTKGKPQLIPLATPISARYIRVWGQGHYIQNTNSSWAGYSNGVLINEIEAMAEVPRSKEDSAPKKEVVNLAALKQPYFYGLAPINPQAINDGKFDEQYTIHPTIRGYLQYEFKREYQLKEIKLKLAPGEYSSVRVEADDDYNQQNGARRLYDQAATFEKETILTIPVPEGESAQYVRISATRKDLQPVGYSEVQILGTGDSYDESQEAYVAPTSDYNKLVWSDEFNGDKVDESKWNIIDGMFNHAAIYNRGAVSIKKDGDNSYLSIRSKNYNSTQELIDAVGIDRYTNQPLPSKVTWSSGRVESKDKYSFQYGRMAVRAKVNDSKGIWPAIWMLAQDETGHDEIDVLEYLGQTPWEAWTTNHFGILAKNKQSHGIATKNYEAWSQNFHVYEVEWTPEHIKWFIDGKHVFTSMRGKGGEIDGMHTRPMFPILETQVGDGWVGDVDYTKNLTKQDSEYLIDWVRVYQKENQDQVYFDNLDRHTSTNPYFIKPSQKLGKLVEVSHGEKAHENKNNFYYGGQPRYETSRLYAENSADENALVYKIDNPSALHLTTYYKTLEDAKRYNPQAWASQGESIRKHLVNSSTNIDFEVYSSVDGSTWKKEDVSVVDNFVEATPAYARTTFDVKRFSPNVKYVKIVFPKTQQKQYTLLSGETKQIEPWDVQLAKVTFTAPHFEPSKPEEKPQETTSKETTTTTETSTTSMSSQAESTSKMTSQERIETTESSKARTETTESSKQERTETTESSKQERTETTESSKQEERSSKMSETSSSGSMQPTQSSSHSQKQETTQKQSKEKLPFTGTAESSILVFAGIILLTLGIKWRYK